MQNTCQWMSITTACAAMPFPYHCSILGQYSDLGELMVNCTILQKMIIEKKKKLLYVSETLCHWGHCFTPFNRNSSKCAENGWLLVLFSAASGRN